MHFLSSRRNGQVMILTVIALGATILGATTVAGLLTSYQVRESGDVANSTKAVFAADTGIEWGLYQMFHPTSGATAPEMRNGATYTVNCFNVSGVLVDCTSVGTTRIRSVGESGGISRAFEFSF